MDVDEDEIQQTCVPSASTAVVQDIFDEDANIVELHSSQWWSSRDNTARASEAMNNLLFPPDANKFMESVGKYMFVR